jgi:hypothetical protein
LLKRNKKQQQDESVVVCFLVWIIFLALPCLALLDDEMHA